jgi:hypothetical protein
MSFDNAVYLVMGILLVAALAAITVHSYGRKRKAEVEEPKYKMLDDDE